MKKGRPAHTLHVLSDPEHAQAVRDVVVRETSAIGMRVQAVAKHALPRDEVSVDVDGDRVRVKRAWLEGRVVNVQPEWEDVAVAVGPHRRPRQAGPGPGVGARPGAPGLTRRGPAGGSMSPVDSSAAQQGTGGFVDSEVGTLREVILHRPGAELRRLTPRNNDRLLFDGLPWVDRAQDEHDAFADTLRARGVRVHLVTDLLREVLASDEVRARAISDVITDDSATHLRLGDTLRARVRAHLEGLDPDALTDALVAGVRNDEVPGRAGLVASLLHDDDFVVDPLPNLLFTRDSSVWIGDEVAVASLAMPARDRETHLLSLVYAHHPRFDGVVTAYEPSWEHVEGGDVLVVGPGVLAVGTGERTTPAGVERLARTVIGRGLAHTCSRSRSPRSGRRCTWTPCARWSTATPSSSTPTSRPASSPCPSPRPTARAGTGAPRSRPTPSS